MITFELVVLDLRLNYISSCLICGTNRMSIWKRREILKLGALAAIGSGACSFSNAAGSIKEENQRSPLLLSGTESPQRSGWRLYRLAMVNWVR